LTVQRIKTIKEVDEDLEEMSSMFGGEPSDKSHLMSKIDEDSNSPRNI
jgi:hypothetical protein